MDFTQMKKSYQFLAFHSFDNQSPNQSVVTLVTGLFGASVRGPASVIPPLQAQRQSSIDSVLTTGVPGQHGKTNTPPTMW